MLRGQAMAVGVGEPGVDWERVAVALGGRLGDWLAAGRCRTLSRGSRMLQSATVDRRNADSAGAGKQADGTGLLSRTLDRGPVVFTACVGEVSECSAGGRQARLGPVF
jgi:hypothetical protein